MSERTVIGFETFVIREDMWSAVIGLRYWGQDGYRRESPVRFNDHAAAVRYGNQIVGRPIR